MNRLGLSILVSCIFILSIPIPNIYADTTQKEGIFQVVLPSKWTRMPDKMLDEIRKTSVSGGRKLAEASKSADPKAFNENSIPFLSGFQMQTGNNRIMLLFSSDTSDTILNREEMFKTNSDRTKWGIDTGRLRKTTKGVSKLEIDGVPCLLQDIETQHGGRMLMYSFFVPEYPKMIYAVQIICDDHATLNKHADDIASIIKSIKVIRQARN